MRFLEFVKGVFYSLLFIGIWVGIVYLIFLWVV